MQPEVAIPVIFAPGRYWVYWFQQENAPKGPYRGHFYDVPMMSLPIFLRKQAIKFKKLKDDLDLVYVMKTVFLDNPEHPAQGRVFALVLGPMDDHGKSEMRRAEAAINKVQDDFREKNGVELPFHIYHFSLFPSNT